LATNSALYDLGDAAMFKEIEDFRFENRFQTRSEATTELIRLGLESIKKQDSKTNQKESE
jgi:metal-responsive CopG/Arc/MetJ family transcriptional regulator